MRVHTLPWEGPNGMTDRLCEVCGEGRHAVIVAGNQTSKTGAFEPCETRKR